VAGGNFEIDARVSSERHFHRGCEQPAVGAIVIREKFVLAAELLDGAPEIFEIGRAVDIRRLFTDLRNDLGENGTAETVFTASKIDQ